MASTSRGALTQTSRCWAWALLDAPLGLIRAAGAPAPSPRAGRFRWWLGRIGSVGPSGLGRVWGGAAFRGLIAPDYPKFRPVGPRRPAVTAVANLGAMAPLQGAALGDLANRGRRCVRRRRDAALPPAIICQPFRLRTSGDNVQRSTSNFISCLSVFLGVFVSLSLRVYSFGLQA